MKVARFRTDDAITFGVLDAAENGDGVELVELVADPIVAGYETTGRRFKFEDVQVLAPIIPRSKIVCVGKNYVDHVEEMQHATGDGSVPEQPLLFLKPNTAVVGPGDAIIKPPISERVEYEGELAVVIGAVGKDVPASRAQEIIFGYTCANDVTARDLQIADGQWTRGKGFDTFCPLGPVIETDLSTPAQLTTRVNGQVQQQTTTDLMVHTIEKIIEYASSVFTLLPGDVILTGTPKGVGTLAAGDRVEVEIEGIGKLPNAVK
jgi:2-keto-4-pentenoate hydratase/2-oxohepta-3-ene-1,7-dioic acid hydratase in catechol pathway